MTTWKYLPKRERKHRLDEYLKREEYSDIEKLIERSGRNKIGKLELNINYFSPNILGIN